MKEFEVSKYQKFLPLFVKATELCVLYGLIRSTPAKEIKKMKLRQIRKELKILQNEAKKIR